MSETTGRRRRLAEYNGAWLMLALMGCGLLALVGAVPEGAREYLLKQGIWFVVGLGLMWGAARTDYRWFTGKGPLLLGLVALLLVGVLAMGYVGGGSRRWIGLGPARLQPSELAKLVMVLWLAHWCAARPHVGGAKLIHLVVPGSVLLGVTGLVMLQPDLGTAVAILGVGAAVLWTAGIARRVLVGLGLGGVAAAVAAWFVVLKPYQKRRVFGFLDPEADPLGIGYHTIQSKIAVGNGGVWGTGLGQGTQAKLQFLPEQHTDFIFSVWAEEWGLVGGVVVLALYAGLLAWVARTALEAKDALGRLVAAGLLAHFAIHVGVNVAMVLGWAPVVGLPLPWLTYGGSAALTNSLAVGILVSIRLRRQWF